MKKGAELLRKLPDLVKNTKEDKLQWNIEFQTTEYNDPSEKPTEEIEGKSWMLDECFVSYHCICKGEEFLLITYEQIASCEEKRSRTIWLLYRRLVIVISTWICWLRMRWNWIRCSHMKFICFGLQSLKS